MLPVFCLIVSVYLFAASCVRIKIIIIPVNSHYTSTRKLYKDDGSHFCTGNFNLVWDDMLSVIIHYKSITNLKKNMKQLGL